MNNKSKYVGEYINGNTAMPLCSKRHNTTNIMIRNTDVSKRKRMSSKKKRRLLLAAAKALGIRILLGIGLLLAYVCAFGIILGTVVMFLQPENPWSYLIVAVCLGYSMLVCNCRAFEYIGDRIGLK